MSINDRVQQVSDDYTSMVERVVSYYARYVDSMWRVVVLHNRFALDAESWKAHILPYEEKFYEHIGLEHTLYMTAGQLLTDANDSADAVVDIRAQGLQDKLDLDTLHAELEHDLVMDLLAQRTMTKENAVRIRWMSAYRLQRHARLRAAIRRELDSSARSASVILVPTHPERRKYRPSRVGIFV